MKYFIVEPEVAGGLGENTVMDRTVHPPRVSRLHYHFDGWLGDGLVESFPCFIATEDVREKLNALSATGVEFDEVEVTKSDHFRELQPNCLLPKFFWLRVTGKPGQDDLGITTDARLVVSDRVVRTLRGVGISHAQLADFAGA